MSYILKIPSSPAFILKGMKGYQFEPIKNKELDVYFLDVQTGHDTFIISKELTRIYYILEGSGVFTIDNEKYTVKPGELVEVPPMVEYSYSGCMKILLLSYPRWFHGNEIKTKRNDDVAKGNIVESILLRVRNKLMEG